MKILTDTSIIYATNTNIFDRNIFDRNIFDRNIFDRNIFDRNNKYVCMSEIPTDPVAEYGEKTTVRKYQDFARAIKQDHFGALRLLAFHHLKDALDENGRDTERLYKEA